MHFYNTRDSVPNPNGNTTYAFPVTSGHCPAGTVERDTCWPQPEVLQNIDMTTGALGLTDIATTGTSPSSIAIDPAGKFAYVANSGSNDVSMYRIDATTGALTLIGTIST